MTVTIIRLIVMTAAWFMGGLSLLYLLGWS